MRSFALTLVLLGCGRAGLDAEPADVQPASPVADPSLVELGPGWHHLPADPAPNIAAIDLSVYDEHILISPSIREGGRDGVSYRVNGVPVGDGFWQLSLSTWGPFRRGPNVVEITVGTRPTWSATVVLPKTALDPALSGPLKVGAPFTVRWPPVDWLTHALVVFDPLDLPPARLPTPRWETSGSQVTATFDGFRFSDGSLRTTSRARVVVIASRSVDAAGKPARGGFTFSWAERFVTPILP
jgi:hypothetical protein